MRGLDRLSIQRLRRKLRLPVFVLALILLVVMLGFVCVCLSDHPSQAADRAISAIGHVPAIVEMWAFMIFLLAPLLFMPTGTAIPAIGRASPERLQRFRF